MSNDKIPEKRIVVGVATYGNISPEHYVSMLSFYAKEKERVKIVVEPYTYIHVARTNILTKAISLNATHVLFIDDDMIFGKDALDKLLSHNKEIVGGLYYKRIAPHTPVIYRQVGQELIIPADFPQDRLFDVDAIGTGFLLIDINVFKNSEPPFFYYGKPKDFGLKQNDLYDLGEDTTFCLKMRREGKRIWVDPTIPLGHRGSKVFSKEDAYL